MKALGIGVSWAAELVVMFLDAIDQGEQQLR
jgi:hypothetical protein